MMLVPGVFRPKTSRQTVSTSHNFVIKKCVPPLNYLNNDDFASGVADKNVVRPGSLRKYCLCPTNSLTWLKSQAKLPYKYGKLDDSIQIVQKVQRIYTKSPEYAIAPMPPHSYATAH